MNPCGKEKSQMRSLNISSTKHFYNPIFSFALEKKKIPVILDTSMEFQKIMSQTVLEFANIVNMKANISQCIPRLGYGKIQILHILLELHTSRNFFRT